MTATEFRVWQAQVGIKNGELAERLNKSRDTISDWRVNGVPSSTSAMLRLALSTIEREFASKGGAK